MRLTVHSYRYGQEILEHPTYRDAWDEITGIFKAAPLFIWPGKSSKNSRLDVVQQLLNTYFDRRFAVDYQWTYHPLATAIAESELRADYRKEFHGLTIQVEVQFGNMARWYSDIFKFQSGYSDKAVRLAISAVPMNAIARRIDSNVAHYERAVRELPSAELSITLPIILMGLDADGETSVVDLSRSQFPSVSALTARGAAANRWRVVHGWMTGIPIEQIGPESETGPMLDEATTSDDEDE